MTGNARFWLVPEPGSPASGPYTSEEAAERFRDGMTAWPVQELFKGSDPTRLARVLDAGKCAVIKQQKTGYYVNYPDGGAYTDAGDRMWFSKPVAAGIAKRLGGWYELGNRTTFKTVVTEYLDMPARVEVPDRPDVYIREVTIQHCPAEDEWTPEHWTVRVKWAGVDREDGGGTACSNPQVAKRLKRAILAGAALGPAEVCTDVSGHTYVHAPHNYLARILNADLRRLGF